MRNLLTLLACVAASAVVLTAFISPARSAPTWKVVETGKVDVQCYGYWWAIHSRSKDAKEKRTSRKFMTDIIHHYTIEVWYLASPGNEHAEPDISLPAYYDFQQSVSDQFGREAFPFRDRWETAWTKRPNEDWHVEDVKCRLRDVDIMRARQAPSDCSIYEFCLLSHDMIA